MDTFDKIINFILGNEGGFTNNLADSGGATKHGISLRYLKSLGLFGDLDGDGDVDIDDIRLIDRPTAIEIYKTHWWDKYNYNLIKDAVLAAKVFDFSVNMGSKRAHILLQESFNILDPLVPLKVDGVLGPKTLEAIHLVNSKDLLVILIGRASAFYLSLLRTNPAFHIFIVGWLNRANKVFKNEDH